MTILEMGATSLHIFSVLTVEKALNTGKSPHFDSWYSCCMSICFSPFGSKLNHIFFYFYAKNQMACIDNKGMAKISPANAFNAFIEILFVFGDN